MVEKSRVVAYHSKEAQNEKEGEAMPVYTKLAEVQRVSPRIELGLVED